jgi:hypothetical protein
MFTGVLRHRHLRDVYGLVLQHILRFYKTLRLHHTYSTFTASKCNSLIHSFGFFFFLGATTTTTYTAAAAAATAATTTTITTTTTTNAMQRRLSGRVWKR